MQHYAAVGLARYTITRQTDKITQDPRPLACPRYAALLENAPASFAGLVHKQTITPISRFVRARDGEPIWNVSLMGAEAVDCIGVDIERRQEHTQKALAG